MSLVDCLLIIVLLVTVAVSIDIYMAFNWHKCPYCGKRMIHSHTVKENNVLLHKFHCPYCGAWDELKEDEFVNVKSE